MTLPLSRESEKVPPAWIYIAIAAVTVMLVFYGSQAQVPAAITIGSSSLTTITTVETITQISTVTGPTTTYTTTIVTTTTVTIPGSSSPVPWTQIGGVALVGVGGFVYVKGGKRS